MFAAVRWWLRTSRIADRPDAPGSDELVGLWRERLTRRRFLRASAAVATAAGTGILTRQLVPAGARGAIPPAWAAPPAAPPRTAPRIVIVGAGIAGLNAAYHLRRAGHRAAVYDAAARVGGRIHSLRDVMAPGLVTEFGGEFINSDHEDLLGLVKAFGLELIDLESPGEAAMKAAYFFDGRHHTEAQIIQAFRPLARRIASDGRRLSERIDFQHPGGAQALDRMSLAAYLDRIGAAGWVRELLEVAYVGEFGLDVGEQSALNLVTMIGTDLSEGFSLFGESDERYVVRGGNRRIADEIARRLEDQVRLDHRLVALHGRGAGYTLTFERRGGGTVEEPADYVILAIPFTILREVDIGLDWPAFKWRAIRELGYGTNAKLMLGFRERVWRQPGHSGETYSDEPFQICWDNRRGQPGVPGGLTLFVGGRAGVGLGQGTSGDQAGRLLPGAERVFPGLTAAHNGRAVRWHWPTDPFVKASYSCYKPGQWTTIRGAEGRPAAGVYFAGEHCSLDSLGYMNGGAETGRVAAQAILRRIGARR